MQVSQMHSSQRLQRHKASAGFSCAPAPGEFALRWQVPGGPAAHPAGEADVARGRAACDVRVRDLALGHQPRHVRQQLCFLQESKRCVRCASPVSHRHIDTAGRRTTASVVLPAFWFFVYVLFAPELWSISAFSFRFALFALQRTPKPCSPSWRLVTWLDVSSRRQVLWVMKHKRF